MACQSYRTQLSWNFLLEVMYTHIHTAFRGYYMFVSVFLYSFLNEIFYTNTIKYIIDGVAFSFQIYNNIVHKYNLVSSFFSPFKNISCIIHRVIHLKFMSTTRKKEKKGLSRTTFSTTVYLRNIII